MSNIKSNHKNLFESSSESGSVHNYHGFKPTSSKTDAQQIFGLYELEETIGQGHFAVVKLARHIFSGEKVAIKVIDKLKLDKLSREHLFQEVRCMKLVQHPNVVRLYEVIDTPTKLYLIQELGDGGDMYDYIMKHSNGLTEQQAKNYFSQIVRAVKYCHDLHVVHRDLKPENVVFFEQTGQVKLTDFGFSNVFVPGSKLLTSCGSLAYSAPEILLGDSYDAPAVDVWSLGVILYMLVSGRAPFQEASDSETLTMILDCKYYIPQYLSAECSDLIQHMLVRDPQRRLKLDDIVNHEWLKHQQSSFNYSSDEYTSDDFSNKNSKIKAKSKINSEDETKCICNSENKENQASSLNPIVPLVKREHLSSKDNENIINSMISGQIASKEDIIKALDEDSYNHITATYYLLAEKILKKEHLNKSNKRKQRLKKRNDPNNIINTPASSSDHTENLNSLETSATKRKLTNPTYNYNSNKEPNNMKHKKSVLVKQEEANECESDDEAMDKTSNDSKVFLQGNSDSEANQKLQLTVEEVQPLAAAVVPLTNIIEDEDELETEPNGIESDKKNNEKQISSSTRRCSRGGLVENNNPLTNLTILEEVETDSTLNTPNNNNFIIQNNQIKLTSPILVNNLKYKDDDDDEDEELKEMDRFNSIQSHVNIENLNFKPINKISTERSYESDPEHCKMQSNQMKINGSKTNPKKLFSTSRVSSTSGADSSCSDNSDSELKKYKNSSNTANANGMLIVEDFDWNNRSTTSSTTSSRSRNKFRQQSSLKNSLVSEQQNQRIRPLSNSSNEANIAGQGEKELNNSKLNNLNSKTSVPRTKSLAESTNIPNTLYQQTSSHISYKQSLPTSSSNSNDQLNQANHNNRTLSIEYRIANMSQMSISSQLSKNNSIRFYNNRAGSCDTPNQYQIVAGMHNSSTTPTPRESIVFNRGDEKPIAKILLSHQQLTSKLQQSDLVIKESSNELVNKMLELNASLGIDETDDTTIIKFDRANESKNDDNNKENEPPKLLDDVRKPIGTSVKKISDLNNSLIKQKIGEFNNNNTIANNSSSSSSVGVSNSGKDSSNKSNLLIHHNPSYSNAINSALASPEENTKTDDERKSYINKDDKQLDSISNIEYKNKLNESNSDTMLINDDNSNGNIANESKRSSNDQSLNLNQNCNDDNENKSKQNNGYLNDTISSNKDSPNKINNNYKASSKQSSSKNQSYDVNNHESFETTSKPCFNCQNCCAII